MSFHGCYKPDPRTIGASSYYTKALDLVMTIGERDVLVSMKSVTTSDRPRSNTVAGSIHTSGERR